MAIVYIHRRLDISDEFKNVFYVGIGANKVRPYQNSGRNKYWHNIVKKYGYKVEITHNNISKEEACAIEKYLISFYGRKDLNLGKLCNVTDGGELNDGRIISKKEIERRRLVATGKKFSQETKLKMSLQRTGEKNNFYGKKHSEKSKQLMKEKAKLRPINNKSIEAMRKVNLGRKMSDESRLKLSKSRKGIIFTEEHKKKLSLAKKRKHEKAANHISAL